MKTKIELQKELMQTKADLSSYMLTHEKYLKAYDKVCEELASHFDGMSKEELKELVLNEVL